MSKELTVIAKLELVPFFTKGDNLDEILESIKQEALQHVPDVSTLKGRNAIKAHITSIKAYRLSLEESGKALSAEYKLLPKSIDATRKKAKDFISELELNARCTLTAWEDNEKVEAAQVEDTEAFLIQYEIEHEHAIHDNEVLDFNMAKAESDKLAEIKAASDLAASNAKLLAENEAAERIATAEREKAQSEQRAIAAQEQIKQNEVYRLNQIEIQKKQAIDNESRRIQAEKKAAQDVIDAAEQARINENYRQREAEDKIKREQLQREADTKHANKVKTEAMEDFISIGLSKEAAKLAVKGLAAGRIRKGSINF